MVLASPSFRPKRTWIGLLFLTGIAVVMGALRTDAAPLQTVHGHRPAILSQLKPIGPLDKTQELNLAISLPLRNQAGLTQFLQQISDPKSPNYRHYLTPTQFTAQFGPTQSDYEAVIAFAKANGLTVTAQYANRMIVDVKGTVPVVEKALGVTMLSYQHPTEKRRFFAPNADPTLNLSVQVLGISGLNNYELPQPRYKATALQSGMTSGKDATASSLPAASPNIGTGANGGYMGSDFRTAYVPGVALTGSGQTVGLLQFDGYTASDITYYETKANLPAVPLTNVLLDGFSGAPTGNGGEIEVSLDIEMSMSMAPGLAGIIVYEAGPSGNWHDILNRMANDNLAKQLSCSWYIPGGAMDPTADQIFQQMAAQGQSFFTASGDYDAFTGLIPFPGDTPYATEVGGTMLTTASAGGAYASEQVWNRNNGIGTGGGISTQYAIPSWQQGISMTANLGSTTMRNVPDVALVAENVYVRVDGIDLLEGGTSCAAPLWAGFTALVNQQAMLNSGTTVGFINPAIYAIGQGSDYATDFHDTTVGNNFSSSSPTKFPGTTGYDLCTGWGTPNGAALINALAPPSVPVISDTNPLPSSSAGVAYNETLTATGGTPGYTFSIVSGNLPNGFGLSPAGVISGTTNDSGTTANFTVQVTDSKGKSSSTALAITCLSAGTPVITTISPLSSASVAVSYNLAFAAAGGTPPYTFSPGPGTWPPGLTLSTGGVLSGTPSATGTYTFDVEVTDNVGSNSSAPFTITVGPPPNLSVTPTSGITSTGGIGGPFTPGSASYQVMNTGSGSMSWSATDAPSWITLSPASGTLASGASTTMTASINTSANSLGVGTYTGTINFNNTTSGFGNTSRSVSLTVTPPPPVITGSLTATGSVGQPFSYQITASNSPTSFGASGLPAGLSVNTSTGLISGTPTAGGVSNITISATNVNGTGSATLVLTVLRAPAFTNAPLSVPIAIGAAYNFTFTTTGTPAPTFAVTNGNLPPGLSLSAAGVISGTPTQLGTYSGTVTATNAAGSASQNFTFTVVSGLVLGVTLPATVNEDDPDGQGTLSVSAVSSNPITVTLTSSNTGALTVPATITVPANQSSVPLPYTIIDNLSVYGTQTATVSASAAGWTGASQLVTVTDNKTTANWDTFGNGQAHTGVYRGSLLGVTYAQAWSSAFGSAALNPVAVDKGMVYVTSNAYFTTGNLAALNASSGAQLWQYPFANASSLGPPAIYKGSVYLQNVTSNEQGLLWSLNAATGTANWSVNFSTQWANFFAPTAYQSVGVWIGGSSNAVLSGYNFNGSLIGTTSVGQYDEWTPTYYNGVIYCWTGADTSGVPGTFTAVNPATGAVLWSTTAPYNWHGWSMDCAAPIADNLAFLNGSQYLTAVNLATHATAWSLTGTFNGTPALANKLVYVITGSKVEVLNENTGALVTTMETNDTGLAGQPIVATDSLVVSSSTSTYLFNLQTGALVQTIPYGGPVSVANGTLYIAGTDGTLRAFRSAGLVAPTITSANSAIFSTGQGGSFTVTATGYPAATFGASGLPFWARLDSTTGLLSGTPPTADGSPFTVTLTAANGVSPSANQTFTITVLQTDLPAITNGPPPAVATVGSNYAFTWTATGYPFPTFALTSGSLPPGLALSSSGALTGTPITLGSYSGTVTASNAAGSASQSFSITVNQAPVITSAPLSMPISLGSAFNFTFAATGSPAPTYAVTSGNLPPGLSLSSSGVISGTPTTLGAYTGTITAANAAGSASQNFSLTVVSGSVLALNLPSTVNESDPDGQGTVLISASSGTATTITFTSSNTGALTVPASITIPAGQYSAALPYTIIDNLSVYGTQTATITATAAGWATANQTVTVTDNKTIASWNTFGNGPAHTGVYRGLLMGTTYAQAWAAAIPQGQYTNMGLNQVAIDKGLVYVTTYAYPTNQTMTVVKAADGSVAWSYNFPAAYSINPPTVYKGNVYIERSNNENDTDLWSLNALTGVLNWRAPLQSQWESYLAPTVYQSIGIWVDGGYGGGLYGFNFNGTQISFTSEPQYDEWTPTYYNGVIYTWVDGTFDAVDPATGTVIWSTPAPYNSSGYGMNCAAPIADNLAFLNGSTTLTAINVTTHAQAWSLTGNFTGTPAVANGNLYVISGSQVQALNESTGASVTAYQTGDTGLTGQPIVASDSLVVSSSTKTYLFNLSTGALVQTIPYGGPVSVANGTLYIAGTDGYLRAFRNGTPAAPTITSSNNTTYTSGQAGSFTITATGFPAPTFSATGLPSWATLNATTGVLSGTPLNVTGSPFTIAVTAANGVSPNAVQNLTVTVNPAPYPPAIIGNPPPTMATVGVPYNFTYATFGFPSPTLSVSAGALPAGLTLSSSGILSGTPTMPGVYTGTVTAANGVGFPASQNFAITVRPPNSPPIITNGPAPSGTVGVFYSFSYTATGVPTPTFSASGTLPPGLTLAANGVLSGTPTMSGVYQGTIDATNGVSPDATQAFSIAIAPSSVPGWAVKDFDGDGGSDILWRNPATGAFGIWNMAGVSPTGFTLLGNVPAPWTIAAIGDFNHDGKADILWRNTSTGEVGVMLMNGTTIGSYVSLGVVDSSWNIVGLGDFNNDGETDILWENTGGILGFWALNGTTVTGFTPIGTVPAPWTIVGVGDFNADHKSDLLWYDPTTGNVMVSLMNGATVAGFAAVGNVPAPWTVTGIADFNDDGSPDLLLYDPTTGNVGVYLLNGTTPLDFDFLGSVPGPWQPMD